MTSGRYVLDASALLCVLNQEPGAARVAAVMNGATISAANLVEVISKLIDRGLDGQDAVADLAHLDLVVANLDRAQAEQAGLLRAKTRAKGLSLGDRACLALAGDTNSIALTGDRAWAGLDVGVAVEVFR